MTINVFISQPMLRRKIEDIQAERDRIVGLVKTSIGFKCNFGPDEKDYKTFHTIFDVNVVNPIERENAPNNAGRLWYLGQAISDLEKCDFVIFASGWEQDKECRIEMEATKICEIPFVCEKFKYIRV